MYHSMLYYYLAFAAIVVIASAVASIALIRRQQHHEEDHGMSKATARHYFLLNPALIAYVLFPVAVAFGAWLLYTYLF
ncbi:MAG: hypothetical protein K0R75_1499 [Paenibacillaceae bacterium]|nr:hypothetical protein [Paenibacillaceae bacterium]